MNKLQDAFDWVDSGPTVVGAKHITVLLEAARKYANPNYEAGVEVLDPHSRAIYGRVDELVKEIVDAVLGVTDPE